MEIVGYVIGSKGSKKAAIEQETGVKICISSKNRNPRESAEILVKGSTSKEVETAVKQIRAVIKDALDSHR